MTKTAQTSKKKPRSTKNDYFTQETQDYIVKYNNSEDPKERNEIFRDHIYYAFYKLAENRIHAGKYYYTDVDDLEDLKHRIIAVLVEEKIHKYDPSLGFKAFSYFDIIVKRWLISYNDTNYKRLKRVGSFDEMEETYEGTLDIESPYGITLKQFVDIWVEEVYLNIEEMFPKTQDRDIADAILMLFKTRYDIDIFKKKALYLYIRDITDCETPSLTKVVKLLKDHFYNLYFLYKDSGKLI